MSTDSPDVTVAAEPTAGPVATPTYRNVICLYPYVRESSAALGFFPPTGLEYVAAAMEDRVGKITLVDLRHERELADPRRLGEFMAGADLICVSVNWSFFFEDVCALINSLPRNVRLIVGGQHATDSVEELLQRCAGIDVIVRGEGEQTIRELVSGVPLPEVPGISYRRDGEIVHNPNRPLAPAGAFRPPNRTLRRHRYHFAWRGVRLSRKSFDTVLTARGCPYHCKFCTHNLNPLGQKRTWSARTPESVADEIAGIDADVIYFSDDNLFAEPQRIGRICDLLLERGIRKSYIAQTRLEIYKHPELLAKAAAAGFKFFLIGVESPHDRILEQLNKGFDTAEVRRAFAVLREYPFYYHCYFIYGNIGETEEEMLCIPRFAREIGAHSISFQQLQARKFSPLKEQVENTPGYYLSANGTVYCDQYPRERMRRIKKRIRRGFYTPGQALRMGLTMRRLGVANILDLLFLLPRTPALLWQLFLRAREKDRKRKRAR